MAFRASDLWRILREQGPVQLGATVGRGLRAYWAFGAWARRLPAGADLDALVERMVDRNAAASQPVYAWQKKAEIAALLRRLAAAPPRRLLEIGTAAGGTLFLLTRVAAPDALLVSIDLPQGPFGGGYNPLKGLLFRAMIRRGQRLVLIRDDSHAERTRRRVAALLAGEPLDFLLIDGDHSYAGVRRDFEEYSGFVREGGLIALHDIRPDPQGFSGEVHRCWSELKERYRAEELVADEAVPGYGIGLIRWGS